MVELVEERRESWGTRGGFILAAVGSAVGLGNLWGFPYKIYSHGGGAFLIPYIIAMFLIGVPMLVLEFSLGHMSQRAAPAAFGKTNRKVEFVGWWGIILGFVIVTFYPVILAYCVRYLGYSIEGMFNGGELPWAGVGVEGVKNAESFFFDEYLNHTEGFALGSIQWHIVVPLIITWVLMYLCIFKGVNMVGKIVWLTVPLPWLMLLILTVRGLTLDGAMQGLVYYLDPSWSELLKPDTWTFAFGQVFFSLSLAFGVMITYASFLHRKSDINNNAAIIGISDFATSFIAGLAVFATLGGMALATQQAGNAIDVKEVVAEGPGLAFVAFPYALAQLPYSAWFSFVFFFALVTLGIDSAFSITESVLASLVDKTGWRRAVVLPVMSLVGFLAGLVYVTNGGLNWLGIVADYIFGVWGIALLGLLECVVLGWFGNIDKFRKHANSRSDWRIGAWWNFLIKILIPVILSTLFFWNLFNDITTDKGFFVNVQSGDLIMPNIVGMIVFVVVVPVISIVLGFFKSPLNNEKFEGSNLKVMGIALSTTALMFAFVALAGYIFVFYGLIEKGLSGFDNVILVTAFLLSVAAIFSANSQLTKYNRKQSRLSWKCRWAGILGSIGLGLFIAVHLINYTHYIAVKKAAADSLKAVEELTKTHLSGVSYVILAFVFLVIIGGLGWCFYRALSAAGTSAEEQYPDEVGDEEKPGATVS